jgi:hypothetical protein
MSGDELTPEHWDELAAQCRRAMSAMNEPETIMSLFARALEFEAKAAELRKRRGDGSY